MLKQKSFLLKIFLIFIPVLHLLAPVNALAANQPIIHVFTSRACPHCAREKQFLQEYKQQYPEIEIFNYEIEKGDNAFLLNLIGQELDDFRGGVPFTVIGDEYIVGFGSAETTGAKIRQIVESEAQQEAELDLVRIAKSNNLSPVRTEITAPQSEPASDQLSPTPAASSASSDSDQNQEALEQKVEIPLLGERKVSSFSLPVLTVLLGFLDGFNPCAMWALVFLITLLLNLEDKKRMWILGTAFILTSGIVYFLFMTAWLNLFLFLGLIKWVRILIGAVALGAGGYYLYDFCVNQTGACKVDLGGRKQKIFDKLKKFTYQESLAAALIGIVALAFAVNLIELVCSAGLPAVYTQVLAMSELSAWQYYAYIAVYIIIFMLDDLFVFFAAMTTLHKVGINNKYARYSHLIGGLLMAAIGLALWFKPELLTFS